MNGVLAWVVRWRLAVLGGSLAGAVAYEVGQRLTDYDPGLLAGLVMQVVLPFGLVFAAAVSGRQHHPAVLVARPAVPALDVPVNPWMVLGAAGYTILGARTLGNLTRDLLDDGGVWLWAGFAGFWLLLLAGFWAAALGRFGVRLTPEGIVDRQVLGSLFIPWGALSGPVPAFAFDAHQVTLVVEDTGRIGRRGVRAGDPAVLPATGVNAELLARAIHEYVNRPELRPAIGTEAELARFRSIPQITELTAQP
ncbi:hypothetical protein [Actinoplanes couchii]|uniref:PH domain-containing protein n=1 Tax=Actinoplanes couchii TaxID=403638 RepID=A0ABQ3XRM8_9ACTN|nr:hypothetical protein [Actinoplanes couchii]MDR6321477.1 hypothetical protein [Actinoplanes couchii]GID61115.1 hypothetical protein Aco03nite_095190 [Actinoplanes couchii]